MNSVTLSVVMPVYNSEKYLNEAIESVLNQSFKDLELIIIDDGSTDKSSEICQNYSNKDSRVKYVRQENSGGQVARNHGIDLAVGKYITFIDSDDYVNTNMYEMLIHNLEKNDADVSICSVTSKVENLGVSLRPDPIIITGRDNILEALEGHNTNWPALKGFLFNKIYKRELLGDLRMNVKINMGEDGLYNMYVLGKCNKVVYAHSMMYYYRWNENSLTNTRSRAYAKWKKDVEGYEEVLQTEKEEIIRGYCKRILVFCAMKKAEAIIREKGDYKEIYADKAKVKSLGKMELYNKKATVMYKLYTRATILFIAYKKHVLKGEK